MIDFGALSTVVASGLKQNLSSHGVTRVIEMDQQSPKPRYPFIGFKWTTVVPDLGQDRRTMQAVPSADLRFEQDVEYRYVRNPTLTLSVTAYDRGDSDQIQDLAYSAYTWFSIPELAGDALSGTGAVVVEVTSITDRDTVLDREIERRMGFDVRIRVTDVVQVRVPTIERVQVTGMHGEVTEEIKL